MGIGAFLMPSAEELQLANEINKQLPPNAGVDFYRVDKGEDGIHYGMVLSYQTKRWSPEPRPNAFFDADEVVALAKRWIEHLQYGEQEKWTLTPQ
jgi:hypothetical protein